MTFQFHNNGIAGKTAGNNNMLWDSPADWISPNGDGGYRDNPPAADGSKVILSDTDHLWGVGGDRTWVWKTFTRGMNPIFMDSGNRDELNGWDLKNTRIAMGTTRTYAERLDITDMTPQNSLCSTQFCLVKGGDKYIVYSEADQNFTVSGLIPSEKYAYEWINTATGEVTAAKGRPINNIPFFSRIG